MWVCWSTHSLSVSLSRVYTLVYAPIINPAGASWRRPSLVPKLWVFCRLRLPGRLCSLVTNLPTLLSSVKHPRMSGTFGNWKNRRVRPAIVSTRFTPGCRLEVCFCIPVRSLAQAYVTVERWLSPVVTLASGFNKLYQTDMIVPRERRGKGKPVVEVKIGGDCQHSQQVACWGNSGNLKLVKSQQTIICLDKSIYFIECGVVSFTCKNWHSWKGLSGLDQGQYALMYI